METLARVSLAGAFAEAVLSPALERLVAAPCTGYGAVFRPELLSSPELALALRRARAAACHSGAAACSSVAGDGDASWKERAAALQAALHSLCQHEAVQLSQREGGGDAARRYVADAVAAAASWSVGGDSRGGLTVPLGAPQFPPLLPEPTAFSAFSSASSAAAAPAETGSEASDSAPPASLLPPWPGLAEAGWAGESLAAVADAERAALRALASALGRASLAPQAPQAHCAWPGVTCGGGEGAGVVALRLPAAGLSGTVPLAHLSALRSLLLLDLSHNARLRGALPDDFFARLPRLRALAARGCRLGGALPSIPPASQLAWLDLSENQFVGALPGSWQLGAQQLRLLNLSHNAVDGSLPAWLAALPSLEGLSLAHNRIGGAFPPPLLAPGPPRLALLDVSHNRLEGRLGDPSAVPSQTLQLLDASYNRLRGPIPPLPPRLRILALAGNALSGPPIGAAAVRASPGLRHIDLRHNTLTGSLGGDALLQLTGLRYLDVSGNAGLTGALPGGAGAAAAAAAALRAGAWAALTHLGFEGTALAGSLPPQLFARGAMRELRGARSGLEGALPCVEMAADRSLAHLDLSGNALEGKLCSALGESPLTHLDLSANRLSGRVPLAVTTKESLKTLNLSDNAALVWHFE